MAMRHLDVGGTAPGQIALWKRSISEPSTLLNSSSGTMTSSDRSPTVASVLSVSIPGAKGRALSIPIQGMTLTSPGGSACATPGSAREEAQAQKVLAYFHTILSRQCDTELEDGELDEPGPTCERPPLGVRASPAEGRDSQPPRTWSGTGSGSNAFASPPPPQPQQQSRSTASMSQSGPTLARQSESLETVKRELCQRFQAELEAARLQLRQTSQELESAAQRRVLESNEAMARAERQALEARSAAERRVVELTSAMALSQQREAELRAELEQAKFTAKVAVHERNLVTSDLRRTQAEMEILIAETLERQRLLTEEFVKLMAKPEIAEAQLPTPIKEVRNCEPGMNGQSPSAPTRTLGKDQAYGIAPASHNNSSRIDNAFLKKDAGVEVMTQTSERLGVEPKNRELAYKVGGIEARAPEPLRYQRAHQTPAAVQEPSAGGTLSSMFSCCSSKHMVMQKPEKQMKTVAGSMQ